MVRVENLSPSFLVNKPSGGSQFVTAFNAMGRFCRPQLSLTSSIDYMLCTIARWRFIVISNLCSSFFQIPLDWRSMK